MKFIAQRDGTSKIEIIIDQEKLNLYYSGIPVNKFDENNKRLDFNQHKIVVDIGLKTENENLFNWQFEDLLNITFQKQILTIEQLNKQKDELLYILTFLIKFKETDFSQKKLRKVSRHFLKLLRYWKKSIILMKTMN